MSESVTGIDVLLRNKQSAPDPAEVREKLSASLTKAAELGGEQALAQYKAKREKLSEFQGQVAVLSGASELSRCKASMSQGICWRCHNRPAQQNIYKVCEPCED